MKKIAILGASYLQLPLVLKAKENNCEVHCFAWDDGKAVCKTIADFFYPISVLDKELILEKCQEIKIDGILTIATDICIPTIAFVAEKLNLIGNSYETALVTTNKGLMRGCFVNNKIPSPLFKIINNIYELNNIEFQFPLIVKPIDRSGSLGVKKVLSPEELEISVLNAIHYSFEKACVIEEYIGGVEVSVETLSWQGKHQILNITDKEVTPEPYLVEIAHHQPSLLSNNIIDDIKSIAIATLKSTGVQNGAGHIEMKINDDGLIYVIEIGSRMGGDFIGSDLVELSTGVDYVKCVLDIALNQFTWKNSIITDNKSSGVYFLCEETKSILAFFENEYDWIVKKEVFTSELNNIQSSNDRSGYLIYQSNQRKILP